MLAGKSVQQKTSPEGEGLHCRAFVMLLGRDGQLSQSIALAFRIQPCPRGTPILIGAGWRSQTIGGIFKGTDGACADPDTRIFPATGAHSPALPSNLIQAAFPSTTQVLCFFLDSRKKRNLPSFLPSSLVPFWEPPRALAKQFKHFCAFMQCFIARKLNFIHTLGIICGEKLWITWTTKWG